MPKKIPVLLALLLLTAIISGCLSKPAAETEAAEQITVFTSFYPLYDFTSKIGGGKISVENILPPGTEPHDWEPSAQALTALQEADLLIVNGLGLEPWLEKLTENLGSGVTVVNASKGIEPLYGYHDHDEEDEHFDQDEHDEDEEHEEGEIEDPHVWLDPILMLHQAENIAGALTLVDPENASYYEENLEHVRQELHALDEAYRERLSGVKRREFVVTHLSFAYMAKRYGLTQQAIAGISSHAEPSPAQMRELVEFARQYDIRHIFSEPLASNRIAKVLAAEVDATLLTLNPLEGLAPEEVSAGDDYFSVMYRNLEQLSIALTE